YHDNGTKKPSFVLLPTYNETSNPETSNLETCSLLGQNFPEELTKAVRNRLKRTGKTYSPPLAKVQKEVAGVNFKELAQAKDLKVFSRFQDTDFVVLMGVVECAILPYKRGSIKPIYSANIDPLHAKVLMIAIRLEIVDMSANVPKLARIELVKSNHMISEDL